jgi:hypothetical protein
MQKAVVAMAEELQTCPECKIGKLRPTGYAATSRDEERNMVKSDVRKVKCDNCGWPEGGQGIVDNVNEEVETSESTTKADKEQGQ